MPPPSPRGGLGLVAGVFVLFVGASAIYLLWTGEYNGDFYGVPVELQPWQVLLGAVLSAAPFLLLLRAARRAAELGARRWIVPMRFLRVAVPTALILHLAFTHFYQVGVIGLPAYDVPALLKPVVLILNRFQPFYIGTLLIFLLPAGSRLVWVVAVLMLAVGILRAGLGGFLYLALVLMLKHHHTVRNFLRHHRLRLLVLVLVAPAAISALYGLRAELRDDSSFDDLSLATLATGLFIGRMSSLTNTLVIVENREHFQAEGRLLEPLYFPKQAVAGVLGAGFGPATTPQYLLINMYGSDIETISYMTGLPGDWMIAYLKSPWVLLLNLLCVVILVKVTLALASTWATPGSVPFAGMLLLYPLMSGVAGEIAGVAFFFALLSAVFLLIDVLNRGLPVNVPAVRPS